VRIPEYNLEPLLYHVELRDYLKSQERELWKWFASARAQADYTESLRMDLLKATYRLEVDGHPELFQALSDAKKSLQLEIPVTLYHAQGLAQPNAALYYIPGEGHVVLSGPVLTLLNPAELKSLLGHELAHYRLLEWENGDLHVTQRLIEAVAADPRAAESHEETARRFQLYSEIFADRGSLCATGDVEPVVACLVKLHTGLAQASAASYIKQAEEIFSKDHVTTKELSHPESFIRARAISLWKQGNPDAQAEIVRMIEGADSINRLDLIGQRRWMNHTRQFIEYFLQPKWFHTDAVLGHARLFFEDFRPGSSMDPSTLGFSKGCDARTAEYLSYVLLDFVTADPELDEMPLAAALDLTRQFEFDSQFEKIASKELKIKVRELRQIKERSAGMLAKAAEQK
jgi:hypothetical protein